MSKLTVGGWVFKNGDTYMYRGSHRGHSFCLCPQLLLQRENLIFQGGNCCGRLGVLVAQLDETLLECIEILKNLQSKTRYKSG
jgi:hypothetical protein